MSGAAEALAGVRVWTHERQAILIIAVLTVARFAVAPLIPLSFDEAYYWRWSEHLALGYLDHPPLIAWLTAVGTAIVGDNVFGVRLMSLLGGIPASWAVWRATEILFGDRRLAATATVFFNLTLIVSIGTILTTPDAPLLVAAAFVLYFLAQANATGRPRWWLLAGAATGVGMLAKFTALVWLPGIFLWMLFIPALRHQLRGPWPWLGAATALVVYAPNLVWQAANGWMTFEKQFGRVDDGTGLTATYLVEHVGAQIGMSTLVIFFLGWMGLVAFLRGKGGPREARILLTLLVWPISLYFIIHALHTRVEGNWTGPIFPAFAIAAAAAIHLVPWRGLAARAVALMTPLAVPVGIVFCAGIYAQAFFGWFPLGQADPTLSNIGAGMAEVGIAVDEVRVREGAGVVLTPDYPLSGWLSFYLPTRPPVLEVREPERWIQEPSVDPALRAGAALAIVPAGQPVARFEAMWGTAAERIGAVTRSRDEMVIATYDLYLLAAPAPSR